MIKRYCDDLQSYCKAGEVLVIYGPRRSGKTTLVKKLAESTAKTLYCIGDDIVIQEILSSKNSKIIQERASGYQYIIIDEAQYIPNIGYGLKILVDTIPGLYVIATGSSSFDLSQKIGEPLTGRKSTLYVLPCSQGEILSLYPNTFTLKQDLGSYLIYGSYPALSNLSSPSDKKLYLHELVNSYLLKDILILEKVKSSKILYDLVKLLALQIGSEVSLYEIGQKLGLHVATVQRYIDLLVKSFVIIELKPYQTNARNSIGKKSKYFFRDLGIRNAIINNTNPLDIRNDVGALRESFVITEMMKKNLYQRSLAELYFWRAYQGAEVDLIRYQEGQRHGYECKYNPSKSTSKPASCDISFNTFQTIHRDNYLEFL